MNVVETDRGSRLMRMFRVAAATAAVVTLVRATDVSAEGPVPPEKSPKDGIVLFDPSLSLAGANLADIQAEVREMKRSTPRAFWEYLGRSVEGRPIDAYIFNRQGERTIVFMAGIHTGPENNTVDFAKELIDYLKRHEEEIPSNVSVVVLPCINPDGYSKDQRENARGVNLNRAGKTSTWSKDATHNGQPANPGQPFVEVEPELQAVYKLLEEKQAKGNLVLVVGYHSVAGIVEDNDIGPADQLAGVYAKAAGYKQIDKWPGPCPGQQLDWQTERGIPGMDVELHERPDPCSEENLAGAWAVIRAVATLK